MKKLISIFIDLIFLITLWAGIVLAGVVAMYLQSRDLAILNDILRSDIYKAIIVVYTLFMASIAIYLVIIPTFLKSTVGEYIFGFIYSPLDKVSLVSSFMRNTVGALWQIITFPYQIFAAIKKKPSFNHWFAGITIVPEKGRFKSSKFGMFLTFFLTALFIGLTAYGVYIYQFGPVKYVEQFINHEKQVKFYLSQNAFTSAETSLEKYKIYNGETPDYFYYNCVIESHQSSADIVIDLCNKAMDQNTNEQRKVELLTIKASLLRANYKNVESLAIYEDLWTNYKIRSFDMINYISLLQNKGDNDKSLAALNELYTAMTPQLDSVKKMIFAELYYNQGKYQEALDIYSYMLAHTEEEGIQLNQQGELYYNQGLAYYHLDKLTEAKEAFTKAKENNPDYTDTADTYIIEIDFRAKKKK